MLLSAEHIRVCVKIRGIITCTMLHCRNAGKLTICDDGTAWRSVRYPIYSTDEEELYSHTEDCNENTKGVVASYEVYLTAGTYYIKVMEATAVLNL